MRRVLAYSIPVLAVCIGAPLFAAESRQQVVLSEGWLVKQLEPGAGDPAELIRGIAKPGADWLTTRMPAQIHDVLFAHGRIPDPRVGRNASKSAWVGEKDWAYACRFASPERSGGPVFLRFLGLDTLATAYLNGTEIGRFDNMYREYTVTVQDQLAPPGEENVLLILFASPLEFISRVQPSETLRKLPRHKFLRKCHSDFGSYLGARPHSVKVGVFRDIVLDIPGRSWLEDVHVWTRLAEDHGEARLLVSAKVCGSPSSLAWSLIDPSRKLVRRGELAVKAGKATFAVDVDRPRLWWPSTHGKPELYRLELSLLHDGVQVDSRSQPVGIREIRAMLVDPETGEKRFRFDVNGHPIFLRGACWAPLEGMTHCWSQDRAIRLLDLLEHGLMNVLRVWGEGHIPPAEFYDECDRRGILIWQDFMFGYGMHPSGVKSFDDNCRSETEEMVRRLRNHPCILLWCGGNENHMGWDFRHGTAPAIGRELFANIMPETCKRLDPDRLFHPSSPHGGRVPNWPLEGDWHDYSTLKFCPEASVPLYASEVGRASAPSLRSMRRFISEEDLWPAGHDPAIRTPGKAAWPPMWQYRSVGGSWDKVGPLEQYCDPASAGDLIRVLGTAHGDYLRDRVERQRRGVPDGAPDGNRRCWGNMVWRLNDSWPIVYWSVIDYYLEPKIPFYYLRRAYDPVLLSFERTADWIAVWVVNDSPQPVEGTLVVQRRQFDGTARGEMKTDVRVDPGCARRCIVATDLGPIVLRREFLHATFSGREATRLLIGERYLHLPRATLKATMRGEVIWISSDVFARQVTLDMEGITGAVFEDNFFDLPPRRKRSISVLVPAGGREVTIRAINAEPVTVQLPRGETPL